MAGDNWERGGVAVITGGASGFGRGLAECAAKRGMHVVLLDRDGARAQQEAEALAATFGVESLGLGVDVGEADSVAAAAGATAERFGRADVVVSNVGVQLFGTAQRLTDEEWRWVLDVNVVGAARTARAFLPLMRKRPNARLAFTASSSVLSPASHMAAYQTSKFALWGLAESLRVELRAEGVTVSVLFPSGMISRHLETSEAAQPDHVRRSIGEPDDFEAMTASNPGMVSDIATPEVAAENTFPLLLAGSPYIVTHGDLVEAVCERNEAIRTAAEIGRLTLPAY